MDKKMEDTWKDIKGFDGLYQINKFGIVKSIDRNVIRNNHIMSIKGKKLKVQNQFKVSKGYPYYLLSKDGKIYVKKVHRLVAIHFLDNKKNYNIVNHKDGNKENFIF